MQTSIPRFVAVLALAAALPGQNQELPGGFNLGNIAGISATDDGQPIAIGSAYSATFAPGGMTFTPAVGEGAPHDFRWTFRLQSIQRGEANVLTALGSAVPRQLNDKALQFDHPGVSERYDALPHGLEQSFVFAHKPDGDGDLIVRGLVSTALPAAPDDIGGYRFVHPAYGGVQLGAVTGIAADGRRCAGSMQLTGNLLELRLPAAFVETASYPMVLDPLIGTAAVGGGGIVTKIDVAYEASLGYLVVFHQTSGGQGSIYGQRYTQQGAVNGAPFVIANDFLVTHTNATVCAVNAHDRFVVAWQTIGTAGAPATSEIRGRTVSSSAGALGPVSTWSVGNSRTNPALCGDKRTTAAQCLLAWRAPGVGAEVRRVTVSSTGTVTLGTVSTAITVSSTGSIESGPNLPKVRSDSGLAVVTLETAGSLPVNSLTVRAYNTVGPVGSPLSIVLALGGRKYHAIDTNGTDWLLAYTQGTVRAVPLSWNGSALVAGTEQTLLTGVAAVNLALGWLGDRYLFAWEQDASVLGGNVYGFAVKQNGTICSPQFTALAGPVGNFRSTPVIATERHGGDSGDTGLLVWTERSSMSLINFIAGQRYDAMVGTPPVQLSPGCPGGGTLTANGPFALGNEQFAFDLNGGDATAPFAVLGYAVGGSTPISCGCTMTVSQVALLALPTAGAATMPFALPCGPGAIGIPVEAQWFLIGGTISPCSLLAGFTASNRLLLTIAE